MTTATTERITTTELKSTGTGTRIETVLLVRESSQRETSKGSPYVAFTLGDEHGEIEARAWSTNCGDDGPPAPGTVLQVGAKTSEYDGQAQLIVDRWEVLDDVGLEGLVPSAHRPVSDLHDKMMWCIRKHCSDQIARVVTAAIGRCEVHGLCVAPAAKGNHHARLGGLIEHVTSMALLARGISAHYIGRYDYEIDLGLVIAGIVFHDLGKVLELSGPVGTEYTDEGRLVGHIAHGLLLLEDAIVSSGVELDDATVTHLRHLILSHHGRKEWGSPVEPKTPEAIFLHQLDMLDSRMDKVLTAASSAGDESWVEAGYGQEFFIGHDNGGNDQ